MKLDLENIAGFFSLGRAIVVEAECRNGTNEKREVRKNVSTSKAGAEGEASGDEEESVVIGVHAASQLRPL